MRRSMINITADQDHMGEAVSTTANLTPTPIPSVTYLAEVTEAALAAAAADMAVEVTIEVTTSLSGLLRMATTVEPDAA
ncbi:hypothetical protein MY10362_004380 [Beauveria mimosiformis]